MEWGRSDNQPVHVPGEDSVKAIKGHWGSLPSLVSLVALVETLGVLSPVWASVSEKKGGFSNWPLLLSLQIVLRSWIKILW